MGRVLIQLIPLVIGSIAVPTWALLVLALLSKGRGPIESIAFVGGITSVRLVQGLIFGFVLSAYEIINKLSRPGAIVSILFIVFGILSWVMAFGQLFQKGGINLMSMVGAITPARALGLGALLVATSSRAWIFTLGALGVIGQAGLDLVQSIIAYLLYILAAESLLIAPILVSARSTTWLQPAARWLEKYNRPILVVVSFVVGCYFLWQGITGLIP